MHRALNEGGLFCFNTVDKHRIDNTASIKHFAEFDGHHFAFESGWHYSGQGEKQSLNLSIEKSKQPFSRLTDLALYAEDSLRQTELWQDQHAMVATSFTELQALLAPYFDVHVFEHDYERIVPWDLASGNALFVCVKIWPKGEALLHLFIMYDF